MLMSDDHAQCVCKLVMTSVPNNNVSNDPKVPTPATLKSWESGLLGMRLSMMCLILMMTLPQIPHLMKKIQGLRHQEVLYHIL